MTFGDNPFPSKYWVKVKHPFETVLLSKPSWGSSVGLVKIPSRNESRALANDSSETSEIISDMIEAADCVSS